jgi:hypothetical protein
MQVASKRYLSNERVNFLCSVKIRFLDFWQGLLGALPQVIRRQSLLEEQVYFLGMMRIH